ncbi:helix-turn-helix domain-containing protein [Lactobacillus crispatus]|uniref:helix-turn-helix domain-containing protein n=1 Tax=Lactobacillus crispatus TaxID=47770 RepID=UPI001F08E9E5|nr:helix-turn-helix domain-containing protein [Lactobacillus crispatus]
MARLIKQDRGNYTNTSNLIIRDDRLSWKARGIFIYLWSQANEWNFYVNEIASHATDGVKSLRRGLDELEQYGYLKRVNRHSDTGSFDGMDWILDDTGSLKESQVDSKDHRRDHLGDDAKKTQNQPKKCQNASDAKRVGRDKGSTPNGTLRNNNNNNYQHKEISNKRNLFSSDPFSESEDIKEKEKSIDDLIGKFTSATGASISHVQYARIRELMMKLDLDDVIDIINDTLAVVTQSPDIISPVAYLIKILMNARDDSNG